MANARAKVAGAGAGAMLPPVSSSIQVVMKGAQNVAQAVVRTRSTLSAWSCMGARRRPEDFSETPLILEKHADYLTSDKWSIEQATINNLSSQSLSQPPPNVARAPSPVTNLLLSVVPKPQPGFPHLGAHGAAPAPLPPNLSGWMPNPPVQITRRPLLDLLLVLVLSMMLVSMLKRGRTPTNNPALEFSTADSEHAFKRTRAFGISDEGMMVEFARNLADFVVASVKKHVIILSSLDFGRWQTIDMSRLQLPLALGSRLPSMANGRDMVAGAGAMLRHVSGITQVVMKGAQNVAQAGLDLHMPKVFLNKDDCTSVIKVAQITRKSSKSSSADRVVNENGGNAKGITERHRDDGFLLSSDYFTIRRQSPKADPARLLAWQEAGRKNLEMAYVSYYGRLKIEMRFGLGLVSYLKHLHLQNLLLHVSMPRGSCQKEPRCMIKTNPFKMMPQELFYWSRRKFMYTKGGIMIRPISRVHLKQSQSFSAIDKHGLDDSDEEGTRRFMVNVIEPQFNLHSDDANVLVGWRRHRAFDGHTMVCGSDSDLNSGFEDGGRNILRICLKSRLFGIFMTRDDIRKLCLFIDASGDSYSDKEGNLWMITGGRSTLVQRLRKEFANAQTRLMEKEKNKSPSCVMRISLQINKVVWGMLVDGKSFVEAEINDMVLPQLLSTPAIQPSLAYHQFYS
ncbi:golgi-body localization protein domain-containing protein [Artemisia annua]|uniref:Golgi-body localization protein domain-containing protein n=1 Tax=Artemisia annua TaxID=35608 RepID=A0A2U1LBJ8_ARTAN|nr:golgi-body localization protein domain-containing protein [Artemisia annua]